MSTHTIWPHLSQTLAHEILLEVQKSNKKLYRTAVEVMAPRMGVRVPILMEMPKIERHLVWIKILSRPEMEVLSFNLLSGWLLAAQVPMLNRWLDLLKVPHADNGCADSFPPAPEEAVLKPAVEALLKEFPQVYVCIYLRCFNLIDEVKWESLAKIITEDPQLQFQQI